MTRSVLFIGSVCGIPLDTKIGTSRHASAFGRSKRTPGGQQAGWLRCAEHPDGDCLVRTDSHQFHHLHPRLATTEYFSPEITGVSFPAHSVPQKPWSIPSVARGIPDFFAHGIVPASGTICISWNDPSGFLAPLKNPLKTDALKSISTPLEPSEEISCQKSLQ